MFRLPHLRPVLLNISQEVHVLQVQSTRFWWSDWLAHKAGQLLSSKQHGWFGTKNVIRWPNGPRQNWRAKYATWCGKIRVVHCALHSRSHPFWRQWWCYKTTLRALAEVWYKSQTKLTNLCWQTTTQASQSLHLSKLSQRIWVEHVRRTIIATSSTPVGCPGYFTGAEQSCANCLFSND